MCVCVRVSLCKCVYALVCVCERECHITYTSLGPCLHHRQDRVSFSEWTCGVVNGGARPPKASD